MSLAVIKCRDCMYYMGASKDIDGLYEPRRRRGSIMIREELYRVHSDESCEEFKAKGTTVKEVKDE